MGISIGLVGLGWFGSEFMRLFHAHPRVDRVALCDAEPDRLAAALGHPAMAAKTNTRDAFTGLDGLLGAGLDAVAFFTQPWLHAGQCRQALERGLDAYSAVPMSWSLDGDEILDECGRLREAVWRSGRLYMLGETTWYRPAAMFCRRMAAEGRFGDFVYAEGEYAHDVDWDGCPLRKVAAHRESGVVGGAYAAWVEPRRRRGARGGPMFYPTHSVSGPLSVMGARAVRVSASGFRNRSRDPYFADDEFSNIAALFHCDNGASLRVAEFREIGASALDRQDSETFRVFGALGGYARRVWEENRRQVPGAPPAGWKSRLLTDEEMRDPLPAEVAAAFKAAMDPEAAPDAPYAPMGHGGSHPYLVHEFVTAVAARRPPAVGDALAAHFMAMGVAAHRSALRDGELTPVPPI